MTRCAVVTINTLDKTMEAKLRFTSLDEMVKLIDENQADWTSLVIVITNPKVIREAKS